MTPYSSGPRDDEDPPLSPATRYSGRDERAQIIVMVGLMAIVLVAIVGLAIDVGRLYITKAELSRAVDSAALSGILEFNGQASGLTAGEAAAEAYFDENEPGPGVTRDATATGDNEMVVDATKSVDMIFLRLIGINSKTVTAHARAGFGTLTVDSVLVLDSTNSMQGTPIAEAKNAAIAFKNTLLGSAPSGNVAVGVAAFRGCYRSAAQTAWAPKPSSSTNCVLDDGSGSSQVTELISNSSTLQTLINNVDATGGSGTNVCGGLAKGWEVLEGNGNHQDAENNRQYMILLSDGDNNYNGSYSYQASPESPHTYNGYSCMPPSSCTASGYNVGTATGSNPCQNGVNTTTIDITDGFESGNFSGCCNWNNSWSTSGSSGDTPTIITSATPTQAGTRHLRIRAQGVVTRQFSLSGANTATLTYWLKSSSLESGDDLLVQISGNGSSYTTLNTHAVNLGSYTRYDVDISAYAGDSSVYLRFQGSMGDTSDNFYIDSITIAGSGITPANGYLNGSDNSSSCGSSVRRERQMDIRTWELAKAIKASGIEVFVVAFGVCSSNGTTYTQSQCDSQIGNTDNDNTADQRLLKCMASSSASSNDHYYYVTNAADLDEIFTAIANQIAHRLIE